MAAAPFKVSIPTCGKCVGIAAHSYEHLREVLRTRYKIRGDFCLQQDDGTLVCDEDYFQLLEPNTKLTVVDSERTLSEDTRRYSESPGIGIGEKGFSVVEADSSSLLPAAKRPRLENSLYPAASQKDPLHMHNMVGTLHHLPQQMSCVSPQPPRVVTPPQGRPGSLSSWSQVQTSQVQTLPPHVPPSLLPTCGSSSAGAASPTSPARLVSNTSPSSLVSHLQIANVMSLSQPTQGHTPVSPASCPLVPPLTQPQPYITSPHQIHPSLPTLSAMNPASSATRFIPATPSRTMYLPSQRRPHQQVPTVLLSPREQQRYHLVPLQQLSRQLPQHPPTNPWPLTSAPTAQQYAGIRGPYPVPPITPAPPTLRQMYAIPTSMQPAPISSRCNPHSVQGVFPSCGQGLQQKSSTPTMDPYVQSQQILLPGASQAPGSCLHGSVAHPDSGSVQMTTPPSVGSASSIPPEPSPCKKVLEVKVVQCNDVVIGGGSEDEAEEEEEGDRLCIVEHTCPPSPESPDPEKALELEPSPAEQSTHTEPTLHKKKTKPPNLQLCSSEPNPGLEPHPITEDEMERVVGQSSPDEGYSSSPSPCTFTKDFSSQLPFAKFEGYQTPPTSTTADELQPGDKWPEAGGGGEEEEEGEIVDVVTVDEGEVNSDANAGDAVVVSPLITKDEESKGGGEESDVDLGEFSSHVQALLEDDPLWEKHEVLEPGSIADVSSEDEVFSSATVDISELGTELIVSVPIINLPNRVHRRKTSSSSSQSSTRSAVSLHTRLRQRRKRRRASRCSVPEELIVKIPVRHIDDVTYLGLVSGSQSEGTEDSDVPSTIELVAASMQPSKPKRVPQIIHLEPHFDLASPPPPPLPCPRLAVEPEVEVADYCSEMMVPTGSVLCSQHDLDSCLTELLNNTQQMRYSNDVEDGDDPGLLYLDVGDEVELGEVSEDVCDCEVTGMDLLNLNDCKEIPEMETCIADETDSSNCKDALEDDYEPHAWKVQTLVRNSTCGVKDPRQEIQRYSFGPNTCFQLCRSHGEWELQSL